MGDGGEPGGQTAPHPPPARTEPGFTPPGPGTVRAGGAGRLLHRAPIAGPRGLWPLPRREPPRVPPHRGQAQPGRRHERSPSAAGHSPHGATSRCGVSPGRAGSASDPREGGQAGEPLPAWHPCLRSGQSKGAPSRRGQRARRAARRQRSLLTPKAPADCPQVPRPPRRAGLCDRAACWGLPLLPTERRVIPPSPQRALELWKGKAEKNRGEGGKLPLLPPPARAGGAKDLC